MIKITPKSRHDEDVLNKPLNDLIRLGLYTERGARQGARDIKKHIKDELTNLKPRTGSPRRNVAGLWHVAGKRYREYPAQDTGKLQDSIEYDISKSKSIKDKTIDVTWGSTLKEDYPLWLEEHGWSFLRRGFNEKVDHFNNIFKRSIEQMVSSVSKRKIG